MPEPRWVPFARLGRPHGLRGELRMQLFHQGSEHLNAISDVLLQRASSEMKTRVLKLRGDRAKLLVTLEGLTSRESAAEWTNATLLVPERIFGELEDDDVFYAWQLEGLEARDHEGRALGKVQALVNHGAGDILVVRTARGAHELPFAEPFVGAIDIEEGWLVVDLNWIDE